MLPDQPNRTRPVSIKFGSAGWPVFGLQVGLNRFGATLAADGGFGRLTEIALKDFQAKQGLTADGIAGPATQRVMASRIASRVDSAMTTLPDGLALSLIEGESGYYLGAVNWNVGGGVDCGLVQRRVYGPPYDVEALVHAYHPQESVREALEELKARAATFLSSAWVARPLSTGIRSERAIRCALMAHNWPVGASDIARTGKCDRPDSPCTWVERNADGTSKVRFPDGVRVETRWQWCQFYAMGSTHGLARMAQYVTRWT